MTLFHHDSLYYSEKVKQKEVSVTELVERALHNIEHYDDMNAVIHIQKDQALNIAKDMDKKLESLSSENIKERRMDQNFLKIIFRKVQVTS